MLSYQCLEEKNISYMVQNKIHCLLNEAYSSSTFTAKTYAYRRPDFRVIAKNGDNVVSMISGFEPIKLAVNTNFKVGGVGLYCSGSKANSAHAAIKVYQMAVDELRQRDCEIILTLTCNPVVKKISKKLFNAEFFDIPVRGIGGFSKRSDELMVISDHADVREMFANLDELELFEELF